MFHEIYIWFSIVLFHYYGPVWIKMTFIQVANHKKTQVPLYHVYISWDAPHKIMGYNTSPWGIPVIWWLATDIIIMVADVLAANN